jgi:murein DD-endopeptidase MepM/ murein hydrolase activator NlpD
MQLQKSLRKINFFRGMGLAILISSCSQPGAPIVYREKEPRSSVATSKPSYVRGDYLRIEDNRRVRDLHKNPPVTGEASASVDTSVVKQDREEGRVVVVQLHDSLLKIARENNCSVADLAHKNNIVPPYQLKIGQKILLDCSKAPVSTGGITVLVKQSDTAMDLAKKYHTTVSQLLQLNKLSKPEDIKPGLRLQLPISETPAASSIPVTTYVVRRGDTLHHIAKTYGVGVTQLVDINRLEKPQLRVGQKLIIGTSKSATSSKSPSEKKSLLEKKPPLEKVEEKKLPEVVKATQQLNFNWPLEGKIIKNFGKQANGDFSDALYIKTAKGTPIRAIADGKVAYAGDELKGFGNIVILKHSDGWISVYGHCDTLTVQVNDLVQQEQSIGTVGQTGNVVEPQLYFSLRKGRIAVDPLKHLSKNNPRS